MAGAAVGFLPFNYPRARAFLGDVGSYGLGAFLASAAMVALAKGIPVVIVVGPFVLYVADVGITLSRRAIRGEHLFTAHREHIYQQLIAQGEPAWLVAAGLGSVSLCCGLLGIAGARSGTATAEVGVVQAALVMGYLASPAVLRQRKPA